MADKDNRKPITGRRYGGRIFWAEQEGKGRRTGSDKMEGDKMEGGDEDGADPRGLEELQVTRNFISGQ